MIPTRFDLQPTLQNSLLKLVPLQEQDFEALYQVASDPLLWRQSPSKDRYQRPVFEIFFREAIQSKAAFLLYDIKTAEIIGTSRYHDIHSADESITIGYTFLARAYWGGTYNKALKTLMLDHAFTQSKQVFFSIGENNIRSQKAIEKLGAIKTGHTENHTSSQPKNKHYIYKLTKETWQKTNNPDTTNQNHHHFIAAPQKGNAVIK
jgi:RimJ/RimL family protein N-acetyltransferase